MITANIEATNSKTVALGFGIDIWWSGSRKSNFLLIPIRTYFVINYEILQRISGIRAYCD